MTKQRAAALLGAVTSIVFLVLAFRGLKPETLFDNLAQVHVGGVLLAAVVYAGAVALISLRWQFLLTPVQAVPLVRLIQLVCIGYMGNNIYPLRAGEALRIFLLKRDEGIPIFRSTTITVVERVFDGIVMLTFILIGVTANQVQNEVVSTVVRVATPLFVAGLIVFFTVALFPRRALGWVERLTRVLPLRLRTPVIHIATEVLGGLAALQNVGQLVGAVVTSYASWMVEALVYWCVLAAFGFDQPYTVALLIVGTVNLAGLIPASPGQIGVYEYFVSAVLLMFAVEPSRALSYAIVVHLVIWLPVTVVGFVLLVRRGLTYKSIGSVRTEQA